MKKFISSVFAITLLSSAVAVAQNASINSPHNYKRPVSQKATQTTPSAITNTETRIAPLKLENNVSSVHNYKRQGSISFAPEATVAVNVPILNVSPLNPLLMPHHYKGHFEPIKIEHRVAKTQVKDTTSVIASN